MGSHWKSEKSGSVSTGRELDRWRNRQIPPWAAKTTAKQHAQTINERDGPLMSGVNGQSWWRSERQGRSLDDAHTFYTEQAGGQSLQTDSVGHKWSIFAYRVGPLRPSESTIYDVVSSWSCIFASFVNGWRFVFPTVCRKASKWHCGRDNPFEYELWRESSWLHHWCWSINRPSGLVDSLCSDYRCFTAGHTLHTKGA